MLQTKQEDITRAMCAQVINNRIDTIEIRRQPRVDPLKKVYPVDCRAGSVGRRQRLSSHWSKRSEDIAFITSPVVDLLPGPLRRSPRFGLWQSARQLMSRIALGSDRAHFVHTNHRAVFRRVGVERFNEPLFLANSGSTRSPNQVSCVRQRRPSAINSSSIRLRLISIFFSSLRYVSRRSSVQHAKGCPSCCGSLKAVAMTSATCSALYVAGRPERGRSANPSSPSLLNRLSQLRTVISVSSNSRAMAGTRFPLLARRMIRARSTSRAAAVRDRASFAIAAFSSCVNVRSLIAIGSLLNRYGFYKRLAGCAT